MSNRIKHTIILFLAIFLSACGSTGSGTIQVGDAWARPGLEGGNSAVFFVIDNPGPEDILLWASSDVAEAVELHKTVMENGNMKMELQPVVPVTTGKTEFKPGDLHVMLIGLEDELKPGDEFRVTLEFESSGERTLEVVVRQP